MSVVKRLLNADTFFGRSLSRPRNLDPPPVPLKKGEAIGCARWFVRPGTFPVPPLKKGGLGGIEIDRTRTFTK